MNIEEFIKDFYGISDINKVPTDQVRMLKCFYKVIISKNNEDWLKVVSKVNFLMRACLKHNEVAVDEFLTEYGKVEKDEFQLDYKKIIDNGKGIKADNE